MLRIKLSKFKHVCSAILLPRLLLKNFKYSKELNCELNSTLEHFIKARKSTNSNNNKGGNDEQMRIIEKCFGKNVSNLDANNQTCKEIKDGKKDIIFTSEFYNMKQCEKCDMVISKLFKNDEIKNETLITKETRMQATTAKLEDEKLAQKIEIIEETPHVEAHAPKVEGFNSIPKVLGAKSATYEMSNAQNTSYPNEQTSLDELAKRCLGSPISDVDKIVVQELKKISQNNLQEKFDIDLVRNQCVGYNSKESYLLNFQTFHDRDAKSECRFERIQPVHLDAVPLLYTDKVTRDYKESGFIREYSTIYFTSEVDETLSDTPPPLSPYEKPAFPSYEFPNKENIPREEDAKMETAAINETLQDTEVIFNDDALQRNEIDQEGNPLLGDETLPKPNINQYNQSILEPQRVTIAKEPVQFKNNFVQDLPATLNIFNSQRFFTSDAESPDMSAEGSDKDEPQNSSISSAFLPGGDRRTLELPENTSISANQNPDEYYNTIFPDELVTDDQSVKSIQAECPVPNIYFSAMPEIDFQESTMRAKRLSENFLNRKQSKIVLEPKAKEVDSLSKNVSVEANLDELASKSDNTSCSESNIPLSLLLKQIQERNRLDYCRNIVAKANTNFEGNKKFACPPTEDKTKSKTSVKPCQPKPKPACEPKPSPCPPKKDPCVKLLPILLSTLIRNDISFDVGTHKAYLSQTVIPMKTLSLISESVLQRIQEMDEKLKLRNNVLNCGVANYARDFQPWIPIPSWPIPKKEKHRPFVCPKEGCKTPVPVTNKPCKEKQCLGISKQTFASEFFAF